MPNPSTSRQRTLRITRIGRTPLHVVPSGALPEPTSDRALRRYVLMRLPWARAVLDTDPIGDAEQRAA